MEIIYTKTNDPIDRENFFKHCTTRFLLTLFDRARTCYYSNEPYFLDNQNKKLVYCSMDDLKNELKKRPHILRKNASRIQRKLKAFGIDDCKCDNCGHINNFKNDPDPYCKKCRHLLKP